MAILRVRPSHPTRSQSPFHTLPPPLPLVKSLTSILPPNSLTSSRKNLATDRLLKSTPRQGLLLVQQRKNTPKKTEITHFSTQPKLSKDLSKGIQLFHSLFGLPGSERKLPKPKVVKLPQKFKDTPLRRVSRIEPIVPQGKTATLDSFRDLVMQSTTVRRPSSYRW